MRLLPTRRARTKPDCTIFLHTHKCAGTSTIDLFRRTSGYRLPADPGAMPPVFKRAQELRSNDEVQRQYSEQRLAPQLADVVRGGINFMATEWVVPPDIAAAGAAADLRLRSFTVLRDPFERFLSNYYFDRKRKYRVVDDIWQYPDHRTFRQFDYYTRFFSSRCNNDSEPIGSKEFEAAAATLRSLDAVLILEQPATFEKLRDFGVNPDDLGRRKSNSQVKPYPPEFRQFFREKATSDYQLYEYACSLAADASKV